MIKAHISVGGSVDITLTGTYDEVDAEIKRIYGQYPTPGYGTWFNWPPNSQVFTCGRDAGKVNTYLAARQLEDGTWQARGHRMGSCE